MWSAKREEGKAKAKAGNRGSNVAVKTSVDDDDLALVLPGARAIVVAFLEDDRLWLIREKEKKRGRVEDCRNLQASS